MAFGRGKIILFGEHAVVYGRPALAAGIAQGVTAEAAPAERSCLQITPGSVSVTPEEAGAHAPLGAAFAAALKTLPDDVARGWEVTAQVDIPSAAGLGASAALGVAVLGALHARCNRHPSPGELSEMALSWERVFHGNPSGIDNHMAAFGGVARYQKGKTLVPVVPKARFQLLVAHSGEAGSTKAMVASVARQHDRDPHKVDKIFDGIASLVARGQRAVEEGEWHALGQLMTLNQRLLSAMMVSTARLEELCRVATDAGALGAKLTGAGGGGCVIALSAPETEDQVENALRAAGSKPFFAQIGEA